MEKRKTLPPLPLASPPAVSSQTWLSGCGFFADAYDLFSINIVKNIMASKYPQSTSQTADLATAAIIGAVIGQLFFGGLADVLGRRAIFIATLTICIVAALGSATCVDLPSLSIYTQLSLWRGLLGFGIGGEYPLSATVTAERSEESGAAAAAHSLISRGRSVAVVFSMQGLGNLAACAVCVVLLAAEVPLDVTWRASLAIGALPGLATLYWRCRMAETKHFAAAAAAAAASAAAPSADRAELLLQEPAEAAPPAPSIFRTIYDNRFALAGTAGSWFIFDVVFYGNGLFTATILSSLGFNTGKAGSQTEAQLLQLALGSTAIAAIGLPGYYIAVALIDRMGRRPMQLLGFIAIAITFSVLAAALNWLEQVPALFTFVYGLTFFWANFGPNMCVPGALAHEIVWQLARAAATANHSPRAQDNVRRPRRGFPHGRARHVPRHIRRLGEDWRRAWRSRHGAAPHRLRHRRRRQEQRPASRARHLRRARRPRRRVDVDLHRGNARHSRQPGRRRHGPQKVVGNCDVKLLRAFLLGVSIPLPVVPPPPFKH